MVVESALKTGMEITIFRIWHRAGEYFMTACEAETIEPRRFLMGSNGLARILDRDPREWFIEMCHLGMPHHLAVFQGHHKKLLRQFAGMTGIKWK